MDRLDGEQLLYEVSSATVNIEAIPRSLLSVPEVLDRLWYLLDSLSRLIEAASDTPIKTESLLKRQYPDLTHRIVQALGSVEVIDIGRPAAVRQAAQAIRHRLLLLEQTMNSGARVASV